jgi:hypothetical protein|tara:strand:- start:665 stop:1099 length:435 start_codon:yes stop_codon:yes gene_type:complete
MTARYDITSNQGETLHLHILYTDSNDVGIDLTSYKAEMRVKRSILGDNTTSLLHMTSGAAGFTSGVTSGVTGSTGGITGGIFLNRNVGNSGSQTGGILIIAGSTATSYVPDGRHYYDMEIKYTPTGETTRIIEGGFESDGEVTR